MVGIIGSTNYIQEAGSPLYGNYCGDNEVTEETSPGHDFLAQFAVEWEQFTSSLQNLGVRFRLLNIR